MNHRFFEHILDFDRPRAFTATQGDNGDLMVADTSAAGTPTYAQQNSTSGGVGEVAVAMAANNEIENVCLYQGDLLQYLIDQIIEVEFRLKMSQATPNAATTFSFGLASARNDAIASLSRCALFQLVGASSTIKLTTTDGTTSNSAVATNQSLGTSYKNFMISFAKGKGDVEFLVDNERCQFSSPAKIDMSAMSTGLQFFLQIQKTAATATDGFVLDFIRIRGRRY